MTRTIIAIAAAAAISGCATMGQPTAAGTWQGTATPTAGGQPAGFTIELTQDGSAISGTMSGQAGSGSIQGTISKGTVNFRTPLTNGVTVIGQFNVDGDAWASCTYELEGIQGGGGTCQATRAQ